MDGYLRGTSHGLEPVARRTLLVVVLLACLIAGTHAQGTEQSGTVSTAGILATLRTYGDSFKAAVSSALARIGGSSSSAFGYLIFVGGAIATFTLGSPMLAGSIALTGLSVRPVSMEGWCALVPLAVVATYIATKGKRIAGYPSTTVPLAVLADCTEDHALLPFSGLPGISLSLAGYSTEINPGPAVVRHEYRADLVYPEDPSKCLMTAHSHRCPGGAGNADCGVSFGGFPVGYAQDTHTEAGHFFEEVDNDGAGSCGQVWGVTHCLYVGARNNCADLSGIIYLLQHTSTTCWFSKYPTGHVEWKEKDTILANITIAPECPDPPDHYLLAKRVNSTHWKYATESSYLASHLADQGVTPVYSTITTRGAEKWTVSEIALKIRRIQWNKWNVAYQKPPDLTGEPVIVSEIDGWALQHTLISGSAVVGVHECFADNLASIISTSHSYACALESCEYLRHDYTVGQGKEMVLIKVKLKNNEIAKPLCKLNGPQGEDCFVANGGTCHFSPHKVIKITSPGGGSCLVTVPGDAPAIDYTVIDTEVGSAHGGFDLGGFNLDFKGLILLGGGLLVVAMGATSAKPIYAIGAGLAAVLYLTHRQ